MPERPSDSGSVFQTVAEEVYFPASHHPRGHGYIIGGNGGIIESLGLGVPNDNDGFMVKLGKKVFNYLRDYVG